MAHLCEAVEKIDGDYCYYLIINGIGQSHLNTYKSNQHSIHYTVKKKSNRETVIKYGWNIKYMYGENIKDRITDVNLM